jgi:hypothetical protein
MAWLLMADALPSGLEKSTPFCASMDLFFISKPFQKANAAAPGTSRRPPNSIGARK